MTYLCFFISLSFLVLNIKFWFFSICQKQTVTGKVSIFPPTTLIKGTTLIRILTFSPPPTLIMSPHLLETLEEQGEKDEAGACHIKGAPTAT